MAIRLFFCVICLYLFQFEHAWSDGPEHTEEVAVREMIDNYYRAWNDHDKKALASMYAHDGDLRAPWNEMGRSRIEIEAIYASEHAKQMKEAHLEQAIKSIRMVKPDMAFVDVESVMTGSTHGSANRHYYVVFLLVKREGEWQILSGRPF